MAKSCALRNFWHALQNACIPIMDLIDWGRSHPDGVYDISNAFGIVSAYNYFLRVGGVRLSQFLNLFSYSACLVGNLLVTIMYLLQSLKSTISDIGRNIHLEHLLLVSDSLSVTGEFHGLTAKALKQQKAHLSISAPFAEACFSVRHFFLLFFTHFCIVKTVSNSFSWESCRIRRNLLLMLLSKV